MLAFKVSWNAQIVDSDEKDSNFVIQADAGIYPYGSGPVSGIKPVFDMLDCGQYEGYAASGQPFRFGAIVKRVSARRSNLRRAKGRI